VGTVGREGGELGSKGWAVDHQPRMSVNGHLHHDHQKGDLQVSKTGWFIYAKGLKVGKEGSRGEGLASRALFMEVLYVYVSLHTCARI
jgi:hypothetical protein